jgi:hypothetical protein
MRSNTSLCSYGLFSVGPAPHSSAAFWPVCSGVLAMSIFNSGRTERAHCANPKPFIDPGMSFWLNTTSIGRAVFRNTVIASSLGRFHDAITALTKELHDGHTDQHVVVEDEDGLNERPSTTGPVQQDSSLSDRF